MYDLEVITKYFGSYEIIDVEHLESLDEYITVFMSNGKYRPFHKYSGISGLSVSNLQYALVAPELFIYFIFNNEVLHILYPYLPGVENIPYYLNHFEKESEDT